MKRNLIKRLIIQIPILCLVCLTAIAQSRKNDLIIKRDSVKIQGRIVIVDSETIQYKKASDPGGPTFHILKSDVARVVYGNGETETFTNVIARPIPGNNEPVLFYPAYPWTQRDFTDDLTVWRPNDLKSAYRFYKDKSKTAKTIGIVFASLGSAATITGIIIVNNNKSKDMYNYYSNSQNREIGTGLIVAGLTSGIVVGVISAINSEKYRRRAELVKGEMQHRNIPLAGISIQPRYDFQTKSTGLSLRLSF